MAVVNWDTSSQNAMSERRPHPRLSGKIRRHPRSRLILDLTEFIASVKISRMELTCI